MSEDEGGVRRAAQATGSRGHSLHRERHLRHPPEPGLQGRYCTRRWVEHGVTCVCGRGFAQCARAECAGRGRVLSPVQARARLSTLHLRHGRGLHVLLEGEQRHAHSRYVRIRKVCQWRYNITDVYYWSVACAMISAAEGRAGPRIRRRFSAGGAGDGSVFPGRTATSFAPPVRFHTEAMAMG